MLKRETATHVTPIGGADPVPLTGVDRLELEGGMVVFQDVSRPDCFYTADEATAVRGHMSSHTKALKRIAREAEQNKADRSAKAADASATGREVRAARIKEIEEAGGPLAMLELLAGELEEWIKYQRECTRMLAKQQEAGNGEVVITAERLAELEAAEQWKNGVMAAAGMKLPGQRAGKTTRR